MFVNNQIDQGVAALKSEQYAIAIERLEPMARLGSSTAQRLMGEMYTRGWGTPRNRAVAEQWSVRACAPPMAWSSDCAELFYHVGEPMVDGPSDSPDFAEGVAWLRKSADAGSPRAAALLLRINQARHQPIP